VGKGREEKEGRGGWKLDSPSLPKEKKKQEGKGASSSKHYKETGSTLRGKRRTSLLIPLST